jgi:hypothetical protein
VKLAYKANFSFQKLSSLGWGFLLNKKAQPPKLKARLIKKQVDYS